MKDKGDACPVGKKEEGDACPVGEKEQGDACPVGEKERGDACPVGEAEEKGDDRNSAEPEEKVPPAKQEKGKRKARHGQDELAAAWIVQDCCSYPSLVKSARAPG